MNEAKLPIYLYIETRPEGINPLSIELLKKLQVDGVGMGVEVSSENFRKNNLNRFPAQKKIINAFSLYLLSSNSFLIRFTVISYENKFNFTIK